MGFIGVDHINGNGLHNQRSNLREASNQQNVMNKKSYKNSSSRFKGVSRTTMKRSYGIYKYWKAQIKYNSKIIHLGLFSNETEAAKAYNKKAIEFFGKFARLNFIESYIT